MRVREGIAWYGLGYRTGLVRSLGRCMATLHLTAGGQLEHLEKRCPMAPPSVHILVLQRLSVSGLCWMRVHSLGMLGYPITLYPTLPGRTW